MLKTIFFDCDGVAIARRQRFSERFSEEYDVPKEKLAPFFQNEFLACEIGKADLKQEVQKYLPAWGFKGSVDDLLKFWFEGEARADADFLDFVQSLRAQGINCFLSTNNEKHRLLYLLDKVGLNKNFDGFFTSAHLGYFKNQQEFWQKAYNFGVMGNKRENLVVDDTKAVVEAAKQFGFFGHLYQGIEDLQETVSQLLKI